jgi:hypothetical protein
MKLQLLVLTVALVAGLQALSVAQAPKSFFPTEVGNLWQYSGAAALWQNWAILQDSVASDRYRYLYIRWGNAPPSWEFRLDTAFNVYRGAGLWGDTLYRLADDSGDVWSRAGRYYAWVLRTYQDVVFGRTSTVKVIRSGPFHPDSGGNSFYFTEQRLASGFGVIYHWEEPGNVVFLRGCVVAGDTFGTIVSVKGKQQEIPRTAHLEQNYPNPFNSSTTITFTIPERSELSLRVYDLLGREVEVLGEADYPAGTYKFIWNSNDFASGIYFCRMRTHRKAQTIKMILAK